MTADLDKAVKSAVWITDVVFTSFVSEEVNISTLDASTAPGLTKRQARGGVGNG
jgi:hypothetical protein